MRSPDGRVEVRFNAYEARMSHWILEPSVVRTRDEAVVMSLDGTAWDGGGITPTFPTRDRVELHLRHYPDGEKTYGLVVDVEAERCWLAREDAGAANEDAEALLAVARGKHVDRTAPGQLLQGFCPDCGAQLYRGGLLKRLRRQKTVQCLVCERTWTLPPDAKLF